LKKFVWLGIEVWVGIRTKVLWQWEIYALIWHLWNLKVNASIFKEKSMSSCLLQDRTAFSLILALSTQKRLGDFSGRHADRFKSYCINILFSFAVMLKEYTFTFYFRIFSCNENSFLNLYRKCLSPKFLIDCVHGTLHSSVSKL
jgi:hypothetical protein